MSRARDRFWIVGNIAFVAALAVPVTWISSAYAVQLNAVGVITPAGAFQAPPTTDRQVGHIVHASSSGEFINNFAQVKFAAPLVVNSQTFLERWLKSVKNNKANLLWSSYPASIRGQVFSNKPAGGDPFVSGGW